MLEIPDRESSMQRFLLPAVWAAGGLVLLLVSWLLLRALLGGSQAAQGPVVDVIERGPVVQTVSVYGTLQPSQSALVLAEVEGRVEELLISAGAVLDRGEVIVRLVNHDLEREADSLEVSLMETRASQQAQAARLNRELITTRNEVSAARAELPLAEKKLDMYGQLLDLQSISRVDYLEAELAVDRARRALELAEQNLQAMEEAIQAELEANELRLQSAEQRLAQARADLDALIIRAPRSGLLTSLITELEVGALIQRGQLVGQISDPDTVHAVLFVAALRSAPLRPGQQVTLRVHGQPLEGRISRIDPSVSDGQVRILAELEDASQSGFRTNQEVSGQVVVAEVQDALRVRRPTRMSGQNDALAVFVETTDGLEERLLEVGIYGNEYLEVANAERFAAGQRLIIDYMEDWMEQQKRDGDQP